MEIELIVEVVDQNTDQMLVRRGDCGKGRLYPDHVN